MSRLSFELTDNKVNTDQCRFSASDTPPPPLPTLGQWLIHFCTNKKQSTWPVLCALLIVELFFYFFFSIKNKYLQTSGQLREKQTLNRTNSGFVMSLFPEKDSGCYQVTGFVLITLYSVLAFFFALPSYSANTIRKQSKA